jgi:hypothetical protein
LSRADPLYSILGQGIWTVEDDSSTDEENPEKIKEGSLLCYAVLLLSL